MTRYVTPLKDNWNFVKSAEDALTAAALPGETVTLPHTWNAIDGQDGGNDYHRGTCYYVKNLPRPELKPGEQAYLEFQGAAMTAHIYVNDRLLAHHQGGYSTFRINITDVLSEQNTIVAALNNEDNNTCYPQKADFTFYGGLYRMVNLIVVPETHFELDYCGTPGIKVTPQVDLENHKASVTVEAWVSADDQVTFTVDGQSQTVLSVEKHAQATFMIEKRTLMGWIKGPISLYSQCLFRKRR